MTAWLPYMAAMTIWLQWAWVWLRHLHCCSGCIGCGGWEISMTRVTAWLHAYGAWAWLRYLHCCSGCIGCGGWEISKARVTAWLHRALAWVWLRHLHCCSGGIGCEDWEISKAATYLDWKIFTKLFVTTYLGMIFKTILQRLYNGYKTCLSLVSAVRWLYNRCTTILQ